MSSLYSVPFLTPGIKETMAYIKKLEEREEEAKRQWEDRKNKGLSSPFDAMRRVIERESLR